MKTIPIMKNVEMTHAGVKTGLQAGKFCCVNWYTAFLQPRRGTGEELLSPSIQSDFKTMPEMEL